MRDPKRIDILMNLLTEIWKQNPDLRFNQLIDSLQYMYKDGSYVKKAFNKETLLNTYTVSYPDLFYVEDDDFIEFLEKYLKDRLNK